MISIDLLEDGRLPSEYSIKLNEVIKIIFKSKKTTVLTGAGISCNAGIPDFRSSDGLYSLVKSKHPNTVVKGQDLFDISLFRDEMSLALFCTFMESLYKSTLVAKATETHKFIKTLKDKNKLLRCYTQNIDSLERSVDLKMGIDLDNFESGKNFSKNWKSLDVVQLHGNLHKLSCTQCFTNFDWTEKYQIQLSDGSNPQCENCFAKYEERLYSGKRLTGNIGLLRPGIVLYGENHPQGDILAQGLSLDIRSQPDLLIIMGTSLKVDGVKKLVKSLSHSIHAKGGKVIFVNKTSLSKQWDSYVDYEILSDCDNFIKILKKEIPDLFLSQEQLDSKKLKTNKVKSEVKREADALTPPTTPTKKKRPSLKRTNNRTKVKSDLLTPPSSFTEESQDLITAVKMEPSGDQLSPLKTLTTSQLNRKRISTSFKFQGKSETSTKKMKL